MTAHFPDPLRMQDAGMHGGSRRFILTDRFRYNSSYGTVSAHKGFITDGASVPRVFWNLFDPVSSDLFPAAVIHDFLYSGHNDSFTRAEADSIFLEAMFNLGLPWYRRNVVYRAVRMFGAKCYKAKLSYP